MVFVHRALYEDRTVHDEVTCYINSPRFKACSALSYLGMTCVYMVFQTLFL